MSVETCVRIVCISEHTHNIRSGQKSVEGGLQCDVISLAMLREAIFILVFTMLTKCILNIKNNKIFDHFSSK